MPDTTDRAARQRAAEQARIQAEYERRKGILNLISIREEQITKYEALLDSLNAAKAELDGLSTELESKKNVYHTPLPDDFGGITATSVNKGVCTALNAACLRASDLSEVCNAAESQIGKLRTYIGELRAEVTSLRASL